MATQMQKSGGLPLTRGGLENVATEKPKSHQELGLCLILIGLLVWTLIVSLRGVDWPAISHTVKALLTAIW